MRLSDAIALGRVTVEKPTATVLSQCALGMAANAAGLDNFFYDDIYREWPWLKSIKGVAHCKKCLDKEWVGDALEAVYRYFDYHVMLFKDRTLDEMIDWVRSIEPPESLPETQGETASSPSNSLPREVLSASDTQDVAQPVAAIASGKMGAFTYLEQEMKP